MTPTPAVELLQIIERVCFVSKDAGPAAGDQRRAVSHSDSAT